MAESMYSKFKKCILFQEDFLFITSLYFIFNEKNAEEDQNGKIKFVMSYKTFKEYLIKLKNYARMSCGIVCRRDKLCKGHQVLQLMQDYDDFLFDSVDRCTMFYKNVEFIKEKSDNKPMFGYVIQPKDEVDIGWKTWSQRMSYLRI